MRRTATNIGALTLGLLGLIAGAAAVPTWPASSDEIEDILMLNNGFNARGFPEPIQPCSAVRAPGRSIAGAFIRTAFHDMAPHDSSTGIGGVDASIGFELDTSVFNANIGVAFNRTINYYGQFFNSQAPMADLIAVGLYQAVRGCGGPSIPVKTGRVDATGPGPQGVPEAVDPIQKMIGDFGRMGFSPQEMIQMVSCGHSIGGVHSSEHPDIVPPQSTAIGTGDFDSTNSTFDSKVVTEYLDGTTRNPLVVGANPNARSDARIFGWDGNQTLSNMADGAAFAGTCSQILERMVNTVPAGVQLSDPIVPYDLKPSNLQLNVGVDGETLEFSGELRVRTNNLPSSSISTVQVIYTDRNGGESCDSCSIGASTLGDANGWDDTFTFFGFSGTISAETSISSFTVLITLIDGSTQTFDNNGSGFPVQDLVLTQTSSSTLEGPDVNDNKQLTVFAAVRTDETSTSESVNLAVSVINPITFNNLPTVSTSNNTMTSVCQSKFYTFYTAKFVLSSAAVNSTRFDVSTTSSAGETVSDGFKSIAEFQASSAGPSCGSGSSRRRAVSFEA